MARSALILIAAIVAITVADIQYDRSNGPGVEYRSSLLMKSRQDSKQQSVVRDESRPVIQIQTEPVRLATIESSVADEIDYHSVDRTKSVSSANVASLVKPRDASVVQPGCSSVLQLKFNNVVQQPQYSAGAQPPYSAGAELQYSAGAQPQYSAGAQPQYSAGAQPQYSAGAQPQYSAGAQPQHSAGAQPQYSAGARPQYSAGAQPQYSAGGQPRYSNVVESKNHGPVKPRCTSDLIQHQSGCTASKEPGYCSCGVQNDATAKCDAETSTGSRIDGKVLHSSTDKSVGAAVPAHLPAFSSYSPFSGLSTEVQSPGSVYSAQGGRSRGQSAGPAYSAQNGRSSGHSAGSAYSAQDGRSSGQSDGSAYSAQNGRSSGQSAGSAYSAQVSAIRRVLIDHHGPTNVELQTKSAKPNDLATEFSQQRNVITTVKEARKIPAPPVIVPDTERFESMISSLWRNNDISASRYGAVDVWNFLRNARVRFTTLFNPENRVHLVNALRVMAGSMKGIGY